MFTLNEHFVGAVNKVSRLLIVKYRRTRNTRMLNGPYRFHLIAQLSILLHSRWRRLSSICH